MNKVDLRNKQRTDEENCIIGSRIKLYRKQLRMTQKELGELIGKKEITVRKYENGSIEIPLDVLDKVASALNISIIDIVNDTSVMDTVLLAKTKEIAHNLAISDEPLIYNKMDILDKIWTLYFFQNPSIEQIHLTKAEVESVMELITIAYEIGLKKIGKELT